jgi:hypothetical protein
MVASRECKEHEQSIPDMKSANAMQRKKRIKKL